MASLTSGLWKAPAAERAAEKQRVGEEATKFLHGRGKEFIGLFRKKKAGKSAPPTPSMKRGGKMRRAGFAKLHRGERVLTKNQAKKYERKRRSSKRH